METGEVIYGKVYMLPRPPPKISLKHDWTRELGSEHAQRPEGQVVQPSRSPQSSQPIPNPGRDRSGQPVVKTSLTPHTLIDSKSLNVELAHDRSGQPVVETNTENVPDGCQTRSCHESIRFNVGDETLRDGSGQPVVNHDDSSHEQTMLNEVNTDFRIPWLPHSVVKHAQSTSVRELIQKIENHPDRHALQNLRQNQSYHLFSAESKRMIQDVGNVELFELLETDPKTQCKTCLSYWSEGIVHCTCGQLLKETVANRGFIETSRPHIWETSRKQRIFLANNMKKRCIKKDYKGTHDRFLRDPILRGRIPENTRDEEVGRAWDVLADEHHTCHRTRIFVLQEQLMDPQSCFGFFHRINLDSKNSDSIH